MIEPSEWDKAKPYAEIKLARIIDREGDADGTRHDLGYLAQLIAETVKSSRFATFTTQCMNINRLIDEEIGIKKGQPVY